MDEWFERVVEARCTDSEQFKLWWERASNSEWIRMWSGVWRGRGDDGSVDRSRVKVEGPQNWAVVFMFHVVVHHMEVIVLCTWSRIFRKFSSPSVGELRTEGLTTD